MGWEYDSQAFSAWEGTDAELFKKFFLQLSLPAGFIVLHRDPETNIPVDCEVSVVNIAYSQSNFLAKRNGVAEGAPISTVLQKHWHRDLHMPSEEVTEYVQKYQHILDQGKCETIHLDLLATSEDSDVCTFAFPLGKDVLGFLYAQNPQLLELSKKERALKKKETDLDIVTTRFSKLFHANLIGTMISKLDGEIVEINDKFLNILGYERGDLEAGQFPFDSPTALFQECIPQLMDSGQYGPVETLFVTKSGEEIPVEIGATVVDSNGEVTNTTIISYLLDLRMRKKTENALIQAREEAIAGSRAKSNFLSTMSHELRTPLAGILGAQALLKDSKLDRDQVDLVDASIRSGQGLLSLLGDVLDLSKIEAGKVILQMVSFDLRAAVEESIVLVGELANRKGLELVTYFDESLTNEFTGISSSANLTLRDQARLPIMVTSDMQRLRQILINLIGNSIKFTEKGGVLIKVSLLPIGQQLRRMSWNAAIDPLSAPPSPSQAADLQARRRSSAGTSMPYLSPKPTSSLSPADQFEYRSSAIKSLSELVSSEEYLPIVAVQSQEAEAVRRILIEVKDTGVGIPEAKQKLLFKSFSQIDASSNRRFEGCGLGLSICKQLLTIMGGSIGVCSTEDKGSVFFFELPVQICPSKAEPFKDFRIGQQKQPMSPPRLSTGLKLDNLPSLSGVKDAENQETVREAKPELLKDVKCLLCNADDSSLSIAETYLTKNHIEFQKMVPLTSHDVLDTIRTPDIHVDILIISLHQSNDLAFENIATLAKEAPLSCHLKNLPIVFAGSREACAVKKTIPGIQNLNLRATYKPCSEFAFLDALHQAREAGLKGMMQKESTSPTESTTLRGASRFLSSLELFRMDQHITNEPSKFQSGTCQPPSSPQASEEHLERTMDRKESFEAMSSAEKVEAEAHLKMAPSITEDDPRTPPSAVLRARLEKRKMEMSAALASHSSDALQTAEDSGEEHTSPPILLLLAEDNTLMARLSKKQIESKLNNVQLLVAANGEIAVEAAEKYMREHHDTYPIIFMDIMMPIMDGLQATQEIRRLEKSRGFRSDPHTRSYIVALTADANLETEQLCFEAGMDEYVSKPMSVATLLEVFQRACQVRQS